MMTCELGFGAVPFTFCDRPRLGDFGRSDFEALDLEAVSLSRSEKYQYQQGWFVTTGAGQWEEWQNGKRAFRFSEVERDRDYIFLYDGSRNIWVALPIKGGRSYYAYGGSGGWTDLYDLKKTPDGGAGNGSPEFRARAIKVLEELPPYPEEITSNGAKGLLFTKMTNGQTHEQLLAEWKRGVKHTTCNDFTGWFARAMGSKAYLGRFDLNSFAKSAWIPATSGGAPKYGDILRFQAFHVGIALDLVNGVLNTAEGGQGGPLRGFDAIGRKKRTWDPAKFLGWVDLEKWIRDGG